MTEQTKRRLTTRKAVKGKSKLAVKGRPKGKVKTPDWVYEEQGLEVPGKQPRGFTLSDAAKAFLESRNSSTLPTDKGEALPEASTAIRGRGRPKGKSSDPNYETVSFISHKELRRLAERRWEDTGQRGLSNLIEALFRLYTVGALDELIRQRVEAGDKLH